MKYTTKKTERLCSVGGLPYRKVYIGDILVMVVCDCCLTGMTKELLKSYVRKHPE